MSKSIMALVASICLTLANGVAVAGAADGIRFVEWTPQTVVRINTERGFVTQIVLTDGEEISSVGGGDYDGWEVTAQRGERIVFLKPRSSALDSNLIVATNRRNIVIDLHVLSAREKSRGARSDWQIHLTSMHREDDEMAVRQAAALAAMAAAAERQRLQEAMASKPDYRNLAYSIQGLPGSDDIKPDGVWDDGRMTYIRIANNREMPAVYRIGADGEESLTDRHIEGRDTIVVHEVARRLVLRLGKQVWGIWNDAYDPDGLPPQGGVTGVGVERVIKGETR